VTLPFNAGAAPGPVEVFLSPCTLYCAAIPSRVTTILGSCVAVCLWDTRLRLGGINHYLLPHRCGAGPNMRFGDTAIEQLLEEMLLFGCQPRSLRARIFGGAAVLGLATGGNPVGNQNVRVALDKLCQHGIPIVGQDTGGRSGMLIRLLTESGDVTVRRVTAGAADPVRPREPAAIWQHA
jgi:chemotaxis protein CheD